MRRLKYAFLLLVAPERFIRASAERIVSLQQRHHQGPYTEEHRAKAESTARTQTTKLRRAIFFGIGMTGITILSGFFAGRGLRQLCAPDKVLVYLLQGTSAAVILGATLGQLGRKDESFGGENLADEMNSYVFRLLYVAGTFFFVMSVSWDAG